MVCICWWLVVVWLVVDGGWLMMVCGLGVLFEVENLDVLC